MRLNDVPSYERCLPTSVPFGMTRPTIGPERRYASHTPYLGIEIHGRGNGGSWRRFVRVADYTDGASFAHPQTSVLSAAQLLARRAVVAIFRLR